jgi:hypothetical protein
LHCQILEKKIGVQSKVLQYIDFKKAYNSVRNEISYNILIRFGIPMKLVRLFKMCLNEIYSRVHIGKYLLDNFLIQSGLKQKDALLPLLFNFALEYSIRKFQIIQMGLKLRKNRLRSLRSGC